MKSFCTTRRSTQRGWLWAVCLLILIGSTPAADPPVVPVNNQPPADSPQAKPGLPPTAPSPIVSDILRLRKQFGDPLKGTLLEDPVAAPKNPLKQPGAVFNGPGAGSNQSFFQALQQVRQAAASQPVKSVTLEPLPVAAPSPVLLEQPSPTLSPLQQSLRQSWRLLDQRAAELEDRADYQEADELRKLSQQIRRQSRLLATQGTATGLPNPR
ncbi:MAG: hypothetical protein VB857_16015 [Pirellulaceae bacterium]